MPQTPMACRRALELIKEGQWQQAHDLVDGVNEVGASHIHAYLHRVEGDTFNANYWYNRAGKSLPDLSLSQEYKQLWKLYGG